MDVLSTYSYRIGELLPNGALLALFLIDLAVKALIIVTLILVVKACIVYLKKHK